MNEGIYYLTVTDMDENKAEGEYLTFEAGMIAFNDALNEDQEVTLSFIPARCRV